MKPLSIHLAGCAALLALAPLTSSAAQTAAQTTASVEETATLVIHAGTLIDGISRAPRANVSVLVHDNRIIGVVDGFVQPAGAQVVDLSKKTVLPGLIDCHVHFMLQLGETTQLGPKANSNDILFRAIPHARRTLEAGFTSVRDVGGGTLGIIAMRNAIQQGIIEGPRMWVSGAPLGPTGGHTDPHDGESEEVQNEGWLEGIIDSPEMAVAKVRTMHRAGVNLIKIAPSGGVLSPNDDPNAQLMTNEEIRAVVDTAHALGMKVAAHGIGEAAINNAAELGVDSVEHMTLGSPKTYKIMIQHGTYFVPTLIAGETVYRYARDFPKMMDSTSNAKAIKFTPIMRNNTISAYKAGVKIAFGTDAGVYPHGQNAQEFVYLNQVGIPAMDLILMATRNAADLIGSNEIGAVAPHRFADIIAVDGDPLKDIAQLKHVTFVMKNGRVVKAGG